jgi:KipI family sensor histidine kinase inhibitor
VLYDGPDLAAVAALAGLSVEGAVSAHSAALYTVAFIGFSPGFAYLTGGDARLHVPRRDDPRTQVPAGSVAVAGPYSGVYPREGPGGWQLLGRTSTVLFDVERTSPAVLAPGDRVRFVAG